jgi:hypothetical protein
MFAFVIVATVAIVWQTVILFMLYKAGKESASRMEGIVGRLEAQGAPILETGRAILEDAQPKIATITSDLAESAARVRAHVEDMGEVTGEIVDRARLQAARLDELITSTVDKIEITTDVVQNSVLSPIRRVQALLHALSAGVGFLRASSRRKSSDNSTEDDEEMFI